ncbi:hypothetical protein V7127_11285 [Bacillus sp. JJ1773]|uniref:hypothetical protein n=1 Tax=Bacillus sp. JJ1773 TaxID=3122965 RepID=UPI002FFFC25C
MLIHLPKGSKVSPNGKREACSFTAKEKKGTQMVKAKLVHLPKRKKGSPNGNSKACSLTEKEKRKPKR